jgi:hypothetical protein
VNPTHCPQCDTDLNGATTCPNCGWQVPVVHTMLRSSFWNLAGFWAMMVGACGGCGYLAYAGSGAIFGYGPLSENGWTRWLGIGVVALYVVIAIGKGMRKR